MDHDTSIRPHEDGDAKQEAITVALDRVYALQQLAERRFCQHPLVTIGTDVGRLRGSSGFAAAGLGDERHVG